MKYTKKQQEGLQQLIQPYRYYLKYGGSRSGKTFEYLRAIILRSLKYEKTKHAILRLKKSTCISTVWQDLIKMLQSEFKGTYREDRSNHIIYFVNGSEIWSAGLDDAAQVDKILGTEWATIYINEASEIKFSFFSKLKTRLNVNPDKTDIKEKFFIDENPPSPAHWTYKIFFEWIDPITKEALEGKELYCKLYYHPLDNKENLSETYLTELSRLTGQDRKRFWEGIFAYNFNAQVFYRFDKDINCVYSKLEYVPHYETWCSWDFGIRDNVALIWYQIYPVAQSVSKSGYLINIIDEYTDTGKDYKHYADYVKGKKYKDVRHCGDPSGKGRGAKLESWIGLLKGEGINVRYKTGYFVHDLVSNANRIMPQIRINPEQTPDAFTAITNWGYPVDADGRVPENAKPIHDDYSHFCTSFYYFCINAFPPKAKAKLEII